MMNESDRDGVTALEDVMKIITEFIGDARDYERCAMIIAEYDETHESYTYDKVMREFGLR